MVQASIKSEKDADGITGGKDYPVVGFMGGCVIIVDDENRFLSLSFANVSEEWTVSTDAPKDKATAPAPSAPAPAPIQAAPAEIGTKP